eukprot:2157483-Prymnesium_polylepis.2
MNHSCVHRTTNASVSICTKHLVRGNTCLTLRSAMTPTTASFTASGAPSTDTRRPRALRNCKTDAAVRGDKR